MQKKLDIKTNKILVVDDEQDLREILQFNLENEGYEVDTAASAEEALEIYDGGYSLILLDIMMGGMSGYKMAEHIRKELKSETPIIFLTAKAQENDLLTGFSVGADDYMTKPFSVKEVLVRVKAVLKRAPKSELSSSIIVIDNLSIDKDRKEVEVNGVKVLLTRKEYEILLLLSEVKGRYLARETILDTVWGDVYVSERTIDVHITNLRKKISESSVTINSRNNYGYALEEK